MSFLFATFVYFTMSFECHCIHKMYILNAELKFGHFHLNQGKNLINTIYVYKLLQQSTILYKDVTCEM